MKIFTYICFLSILFSFALQAQETASKNNYVDVIYLKNGSQFRGQLVEYKPRQYAKIKILGGHQITFEARDIKKIRQEWLDEEGITFMPKSKYKPYNFKERGIYVASNLGMLTGTAAWNNELLWGIAADATVGFQYNRWIGTGIGIGINNYYPSAGEVLYPIFAEARGYFLPQNVSPYYALAAGYSFAFKNEDKNIVKAEGGLMIYPSLGCRFGGSDKTNFTLDFGVKIQQASFTRNGWGWQGSELNRQEMVFKRFTTRVGLVF